MRMRSWVAALLLFEHAALSSSLPPIGRGPPQNSWPKRQEVNRSYSPNTTQTKAIGDSFSSSSKVTEAPTVETWNTLNRLTGTPVSKSQAQELIKQSEQAIFKKHTEPLLSKGDPNQLNALQKTFAGAKTALNYSTFFLNVFGMGVFFVAEGRAIAKEVHVTTQVPSFLRKTAGRLDEWLGVMGSKEFFRRPLTALKLDDPQKASQVYTTLLAGGVVTQNLLGIDLGIHYQQPGLLAASLLKTILVTAKFKNQDFVEGALIASFLNVMASLAYSNVNKYNAQLPGYSMHPVPDYKVILDSKDLSNEQKIQLLGKRTFESLTRIGPVILEDHLHALGDLVAPLAAWLPHSATQSLQQTFNAADRGLQSWQLNRKSKDNLESHQAQSAEELIDLLSTRDGMHSFMKLSQASGLGFVNALSAVMTYLAIVPKMRNVENRWTNLMGASGLALNTYVKVESGRNELTQGNLMAGLALMIPNALLLVPDVLTFYLNKQSKSNKGLQVLMSGLVGVQTLGAIWQKEKHPLPTSSCAARVSSTLKPAPQNH